MSGLQKDRYGAPAIGSVAVGEGVTVMVGVSDGDGVTVIVGVMVAVGVSVGVGVGTCRLMWMRRSA